MFDFLLLWWVLASLPVTFAQQRTHLTEFGGLLYEKKGNVSLTVFALPFGNECSGEVERNLEEVISTIWTIEALNAYLYLPGITIGLSVFDVCDTIKDETALHEMADGLSRNDEEGVNIGIMTTPEIFKKLETLDISSDIVHFKHIISNDMLADITVQLLLNLQWTNITTLVFDSENEMNLFRLKAGEEQIFVQNTVLMNCSNSCSEFRYPEEVKPSSVTVVVASFDNIFRLSKKFYRNMKLVLTPTDFIFKSNLLDLPENTIVSLPPMQDKRVLSALLNNIQGHKGFFSHKPPVKGPLFLGIAATIITFLRPLRTALEENCQNENLREQPCVFVADFIDEIKGNKSGLLSHKTMEISPYDVEEALKVLKIEPSSNDEMFLYIASVINANASEDFAIFQTYNLELKMFQATPLMINDGSLRVPVGEDSSKTHKSTPSAESHRRYPSASPLQEFSTSSEEVLRPTDLKEDDGNDLCKDHQDVLCQSLEGNFTPTTTIINSTGDDTPLISWRFFTWVFVNTSISLVGITCTLSIILFVIIKICKNDFLEGSPFFMLLLMVSVVLTYISSFPFHVDFPQEGFMCGYRKCVPPVVFAVLFSLLLSRSIMIAFREAGGELSGQVNGYLQSILGIFMVGVQTSITLQNWIMGAGVQNLTCSEKYDRYNIFFTLFYDVLLLILLACVSPFMVRSKQNYKEGLLFSISVFFITIVWSAWISFYILLPKEHRDAAVAIGLNSTASVLLLCVFIPQMYFMSSPFSQDQTLRSLSVLDRTVLPGGSHSEFKSSHALNDCAFGSYKNCEMGCVNPSFLTSRPNGGNSLGEADNFGESVCDMTVEASHRN